MRREAPRCAAGGLPSSPRAVKMVRHARVAALWVLAGASGCAAPPLAPPGFSVRVCCRLAGRCRAATLRQPAASTHRRDCMHLLPPHTVVRPSPRTA